jgi:hypothetical protein
MTAPKAERDALAGVATGISFLAPNYVQVK